MSGLMLLILLFAGVALAILMARRGDPVPTADRAAPWIVTGFAAINIAGLLALLWAIATMLYYDGVMLVELSLCLVPAALLAVIVRAGFALARGGRIRPAIGLLALGAVPVMLIVGFLLWLESHPIDMR